MIVLIAVSHSFLVKLDFHILNREWKILLIKPVLTSAFEISVPSLLVSFSVSSMKACGSFGRVRFKHKKFLVTRFSGRVSFTL